jgi:hypothetical protein
VEAPPSIPSLFDGKGTGSATMETVTFQPEADRHKDARDLRRQQARRDDARGTDRAYEGLTFDAGRRWVSR